MPSLERGSNRIVIVGASSLLGAELRGLLEESRFAGADFRLVDEELAVGTLTEAGGEPAMIQPVEEGSFEKAGVIFFTGSSDFTLANFETASRSGAVRHRPVWPFDILRKYFCMVFRRGETSR